MIQIITQRIRKFIRNNKLEIVFAVLFNLLGMISGIFMKQSLIEWYPTLIKSNFNPPNWIFGPVWTILYIMLGIVFAKLVKNRENQKQLFNIFFAQMVLNYTWTPLFFVMKRIDLGLYNLIIMWLLTTVFIYKARNEKTLFLMTLPYFLWISFAGFLNYQMYILN